MPFSGKAATALDLSCCIGKLTLK